MPNQYTNKCEAYCVTGKRCSRKKMLGWDMCKQHCQLVGAKAAAERLDADLAAVRLAALAGGRQGKPQETARMTAWSFVATRSVDCLSITWTGGSNVPLSDDSPSRSW